MKPSPDVKKVWSYSILTKSIIYSFIVFMAELIMPVKFSENLGMFFGMTAVIVFFIGLIISVTYPSFAYQFWRYDVNENEIFVEHGIITRISTTAPISRIQHIDIKQNLYERMTGLARLIIYTAGSKGADIELPGLYLQYAQELRASLKVYIHEDVV